MTKQARTATTLRVLRPYINRSQINLDTCHEHKSPGFDRIIYFIYRVNDRIITVNGISLQNVDYATAVQVLKDSGDTVHLLIKRRIYHYLPSHMPLSAFGVNAVPSKVTLTKNSKKEGKPLAELETNFNGNKKNFLNIFFFLYWKYFYLFILTDYHSFYFHIGILFFMHSILL